MTQFWKLEEYPQGKFFCTENKKCESIFNRPVKNLADGKLQVDLPFIKTDISSRLRDLFNCASQRFFG